MYHTITDLLNLEAKSDLLPRKNTPVILLLTGGIDSSILWWQLLEKFQLNVYPFFAQTGFTLSIKSTFSAELRSINHFYSIFKKKYGTKCHKPYVFKKRNHQIIKETIVAATKNPTFLLNHALPSGQIAVNSHGLMSNLAFHALDYAQLLEAEQNIQVDHLYCGVTSEDGTLVSSQTLLSLRVINLQMVVTSSKKKYFGSLFAEPLLNNTFRKSDIIDLAPDWFPLDKTWSCYKNLILHCGQCVACEARKLEFSLSQKNDSTLYLESLPHKIKKLIKFTSIPV